jgi:hypothetical protein
LKERKIEKEKEKKMKLILKCGLTTNGGHCKAKENQETGLYEECVFSKWTWTEWKKECEGKSKEETIKFLQDSIMTLGFKMGECRKRIERTWRNHNKKEIKVENIRQKIEKEINKINCKIKSLSLLKSNRFSKIKL